MAKITNQLFVLVFYLISMNTVFSQIDPDGASSLMVLHQATDLNEINAINNPELGSIIYNSNDTEVYRYTNSGWQVISTSTSTYTGHFLISNTGNMTISEIPFTPREVKFIAYANVETENINSDNAVGNNNGGIANSFGYMTGYARRNTNNSITQQVIYGGGHGNSINDISRYANSSQCIGLRYGNQNGDSLGLTTASLTSFDTNGFTINVNQVSDGILVIYEAHR